MPGAKATEKPLTMKLNRRDVLKCFPGTIAATLICHRNLLEPCRVETETARQTTHPVRLDRNENVYGPSPAVRVSIQAALLGVSRYPEPADALLNTLAKLHKIKPEQILLGVGTSDLLRMAATAYLGPGDKLIMGTPSYELIRSYAQARGTAIVQVPLRKDHAHDLEAMLASTNANTGLIYICNPNNPTGTLTEHKALQEFIDGLRPSVMVIVDEAYHEYAGDTGAYRSFLESFTSRDNLIVTRTFSKAYALAGLRLGYAAGSEATIRRLAQHSLDGGINCFALLAGSAALSDTKHLLSCIRKNQNDRQEFINQVNARMLRVLDSHGNFACLNVMRPAQQILEHYKKNNMVLGPGIPYMPTYVRVSLGRPEEMKEFWRVWDLLGNHPMAM